VGAFVNWMTLFGLGLIVGGVALLASAFIGARRGARARRQRVAWRRLDRDAGRRSAVQHEIRRSALLADTVLLNEVKANRPG
jgi:hypothetical protein